MKLNLMQNKTSNTKPYKRSRYVAIIVSLVLIVSLYQLWIVWPTLVIKSISWQREVNALLADLLYDAKTNPLIAGAYLAGVSFLYGMLHSLGPGHGKVIVTTYLATHPTKVKSSLILTVVSAMCQALVAVVLVTILLWGFSASMQTVNLKATFFVSLSFALVAVLGGLICWKAVKQLYRSTSPTRLKITPLTLIQVNAQEDDRVFSLKSPFHHSSNLNPGINANAVESHHIHHDECGCGHKHVVDAESINRASTWREYIGIVATIGIRPCTGAIMVLLFANMVDLYWMGVISAVVMGAGTALTTSIIAIMTLAGKHLIKRYLVTEKSSHQASWKLAGYSLQLFAGLLLIVFGLLFMGSQDFGISPMFSV